VNRSLVRSRRVAVRIVKVEIGEFEANSLAVAGVQAVPADDVRRVAAPAALAAPAAVARWPDHAGLVMTGAHQIRAAIYAQADSDVTLSRIYASWFLPPSCRKILREMFVAAISLKYALLVSQWSHGHFLKLTDSVLFEQLDKSSTFGLTQRIISCYRVIPTKWRSYRVHDDAFCEARFLPMLCSGCLELTTKTVANSVCYCV